MMHGNHVSPDVHVVLYHLFDSSDAACCGNRGRVVDARHADCEHPAVEHVADSHCHEDGFGRDAELHHAVAPDDFYCGYPDPAIEHLEVVVRPNSVAQDATAVGDGAVPVHPPAGMGAADHDSPAVDLTAVRCARGAGRVGLALSERDRSVSRNDHVHVVAHRTSSD